MQERIQKILSTYGIASRRQAEELVLKNKVKINNTLAKIGDKADPDKDEIYVNNKKINLQPYSQKVYFIVNKPKNFVCSKKDRHADNLVNDLVPRKYRKQVWPVGRLDKDSTGLMVLTNDGELTQRLTHPSFKHQKEYEVEVNKKIDQKFLDDMQEGVQLKEGLAQADEIKILSDKRFSLVLHQGWNRQIRRMCWQLGYRVVELKRIRIDKIKLGDLKEGECKTITNNKL